jgi:hypothetical protein
MTGTGSPESTGIMAVPNKVMYCCARELTTLTVKCSSNLVSLICYRELPISGKAALPTVGTGQPSHSRELREEAMPISLGRRLPIPQPLEVRKLRTDSVEEPLICCHQRTVPLLSKGKIQGVIHSTLVL